MAPVEHLPDNNISWKLLLGSIITIVPATLCVIVRFVSRHVARAGLWWDDYTIAIALVLNMATAILRWIQIPAYDYGRHPEYVSKEKKIGFGKTFLAIQILYFLNVTMTRASILLLYRRIFGVVTRFRRALYFAGILLILYFVSCVIVSIAGCSPVSKFWDTSLPGHCINEVAFFRWNGVANVFLDLMVLLLPLPMIWRIKTTRRQKWLLTGIFLLGGFVCVVSIVRVVHFNVANFGDPTYSSLSPATWSSVEQSTGIVCACLPTFRPLFRTLYGPSRSKASSVRGNGSISDSQDRDSFRRSMSQCDEDSSIVRFSSQQGMRGASAHRLDTIQNVGHSPTSGYQDDERPGSQSSQTNRPVSAA
ncbi:uncharacterized protein N7515_008231, partial [Penicillium bovifimosum]